MRRALMLAIVLTSGCASFCADRRYIEDVKEHGIVTVPNTSTPPLAGMPTTAAK